MIQSLFKYVDKVLSASREEHLNEHLVICLMFCSLLVTWGCSEPASQKKGSPEFTAQHDHGEHSTAHFASSAKDAVSIGNATDQAAKYAGKLATEPTQVRYRALLSEWQEQRIWEPETNELPEVKGLYEVSYYPNMVPTEDQKKEADAFEEKTRAAIERRGWSDVNKAMADGFYPFKEGNTHFMNPDYLLDKSELDPDRPESLIYFDTPGGKRLGGVMYYLYALDDKAQGPQFGGPLTVWHYHYLGPFCALAEERKELPLNADGECDRGIKMSRTAEMLHVWLLDHPRGTFASEMRIPDSVLQQLEE